MKATGNIFSIVSSLFFTFIIFSSTSLYSQTATIFPGNWSNNSNWSGTVPNANSVANVNHLMNLDVNLFVSNGLYKINEIGGLTSSSNNSIKVSGSGTFDVDGNVNINGDLLLSNSATLYVRSYDTLIVGDAEFRNNAVVIIEAFAVMIVNGDLELRNNNNTTLDGNLFINGNVTARNSSTIVGTGSLEATGEVDLNNSTNFFGNTNPCSPGPCEYGSGGGLPIQLISFKAEHLENGMVNLMWETETELNNNYFIVEKSLDGFIYTEIAKVEGAGNSISNTRYELQVPSDQKDTYYRLTQVDFDGLSKSFNPIALEGRETPTNDWAFYPNPSNSDQMLKLIIPQVDENTSISIRDINGKLLMEQELNNNVTEFELGHSFKSGIYFLSLISRNNTSTKRLIIN